MIRHYFKIIWKRRNRNALLLIELILVFWVVFCVFAYGISRFRNYSTPPGFDPEHVYRVNFNWTFTGNDTASYRKIPELVKQNVRALPEVEAASFSVSVAPYLGNVWSTTLKDKTFHTGDMDADYGDVWKIDMADGRFYSREETGGRYKPVVVTRKFVELFLRDSLPEGVSPAGRVVHFSESQVLVTGVAENFKHLGDFATEEAFMFTPLPDGGYPSLLSIRVKPGTGPEVQKKLNDLIQGIAKDIDFDIVKSENDRDNVNSRTLIPLLSMLFLALFLMVNIAMGLFGILRYNIAQRVSEIGLRKAVGATSGAIRRQFTGEALVLTTVAFLVAFVFAVQAPFVSTLPVETDSFLMGIGAGALVIYGIVYFCCLFPSLQAARVFPAEALHED